MTEHRRHPRAPIELKVSYHRLNSFLVDYTRNVSVGGMFVRTARPLAPGTRFEFRLTVPGHAEPLSLVGEVIHRVEEGPEKGMGLRFVWEDEGAAEAFRRAVERLVQDSLGAQTAAALLGKGAPRR